MKIEKLSRKEKENLYNKKMDELQVIWGNPPDQGPGNFSDWTDEQLEKGLKDTIGQIRFEKSLSFIKKLALYSVYAFVALGVIGLLIFGVKQLF